MPRINNKTCRIVALYVVVGCLLAVQAEALDCSGSDLYAPQGIFSGSGSKQTFSWDQKAAEWLCLQIYMPVGWIRSEWFDASLICNGDNCTVTPNRNFSVGNYWWWLITWSNACGYQIQPGGKILNFTVAPCSSPALYWPTGSSSAITITPTFKWAASPAQWIQLQVASSRGIVFFKWFDATICTADNCTVKPDMLLLPDNYTWWINTWSETCGYQVQPDGQHLNFSVAACTDPGLVLYEPIGGVTVSQTPTFKWKQIGAQQYMLTVDRVSGDNDTIVLRKWYNAADICNTDNCTVTPESPLPPGTVYWWLNTWNDACGFLAQPSGNLGYCSIDYTWKDLGIIYTAPSGTAYYPSVIYDAGGFGNTRSKYAMWYTDGNGAAFLVTTDNVSSWSTPDNMTGLGGHANHVQVLYDANNFGLGPSGPKYRIWYWDMNANLYDISAIATARSSDGVHWNNKTALTQDPAAQLVNGAGVGWNRGSYGPVYFFYQPGALNTGTDPWNHSYVMYYDGTTGGQEATGLAYSTDGLYWHAYTANPVLPVEGGSAWDANFSSYGTVYRDGFGGMHYWYSGGITQVGDGIGYAYSADNGMTWSRRHNIFHISDGIAYRSQRVYTPSVIDDGSGILKMFYTALGNTGGLKKIGLAVSPP